MSSNSETGKAPRPFPRLFAAPSKLPPALPVQTRPPNTRQSPSKGDPAAPVIKPKLSPQLFSLGSGIAKGSSTPRTAAPAIGHEEGPYEPFGVQKQQCPELDICDFLEKTPYWQKCLDRGIPLAQLRQKDLDAAIAWTARCDVIEAFLSRYAMPSRSKISDGSKRSRKSAVPTPAKVMPGDLPDQDRDRLTNLLTSLRTKDITRASLGSLRDEGNFMNIFAANYSLTLGPRAIRPTP